MRAFSSTASARAVSRHHTLFSIAIDHSGGGICSVCPFGVATI